MFTGIVEELGTVAAVEDQGDAIRLTIARRHRARGRRARRLDLGQRLLPDRRRRSTTSTLDRRRHAGDPRQDQPARRAARRPGQPRARGHRRQAPRRPHRPGPRRRRRHGRRPHAQRALGGRRDLAARPSLARYLVDKGSITVDGVSLTVVEAGDDRLHGQPDPRDPRPHHARPPAARRPGQPRGRRHRQARREAARLRRRRRPAMSVRSRRCYDAQPDHRRPPDHLARDRRQRLRLRLAPSAACAAGSGRGRSGSSATCCSSPSSSRPPSTRRPSSRCSARPAARSSSSSPASTAGSAGSRPRAAHGDGDAPRDRPRAGRPRRERVGLPPRRGGAASLVCQWVFSVIGAGWPAPRWYYWCDAWIFVGSMLATYAMARGWADFWLVWIAVDLVGVPLLWHSGYYPTADPLRLLRRARASCGFVVWRRASHGRTRPATPRRRSRMSHEPGPTPSTTASASTPSSAPSPTSPPARPSSSSTTRTARTRATSSSPPARRPRS